MSRKIMAKGLYCLMIFFWGCKLAEPSLPKYYVHTPPSFDFNGQGDSLSPATWELLCVDSQLVAFIDTALQNNYDMAMAMQRLAIARAQVRYFTGQQFPSLMLEASAGQRRHGEYTEAGVGNYDTRLSPNIPPDKMIPDPIPDYFAGGAVSWELDLWGKLRNKRKSAIARFYATREGMLLTKTTIVSEVAMTYYRLLALNSKLKIIEDNIRLQEKGLRIVSVQKEVGKVTELAVKQFESQLLNARGEREELKQQWIETESYLNFLLARYPQPLDLKKEIMGCALPSSVTRGIHSGMLLLRPDVRQAEMELIAAHADVRAARAALFPSVIISASAGYNAFNPSVLFSPASVAYNLVGGITAPLFNRSALRAGYLSARAYREEVLLNYRKTIMNGFYEVYTLVNHLHQMERLFLLKQQEMQNLMVSLDAWEELFMSGRASYLEILISQKQLLKVKQELVDIRLNQFMALIKLYKAAGGGWQFNK